jgi:hypothetical protein
MPIINVLPTVSSLTQIYFTVILSNYSLNQATITNIQALYGNVGIVGTGFTAYDDTPIALAVTAELSGVEYLGILYTKAVYGNILPDNFSRLVQKIPLGIFSGGIVPATFVNGVRTNTGTIIGNDFKARSQMMDDYYTQYFFTVNQVWSNAYSPALEFEYNGTVGLLSTSTYVNELFQLIATLPTVYLNVYDLELYISKYIYYRLGTVSAVYINDHVEDIELLWNLGIAGYTELGSTTVLGEGDTPVVSNLDWTVFNASAFTAQFKTEITNLIIRISRADIGNTVTFSNQVTPTSLPSVGEWNLGIAGYTELDTTTILGDTPPAPDTFILIGATYFSDPRLLYDKCLEYIGDSEFPLNVIGYQKIF